jgi:hypothetical protein
MKNVLAVLLFASVAFGQSAERPKFAKFQLGQTRADVSAVVAPICADRTRTDDDLEQLNRADLCRALATLSDELPIGWGFVTPSVAGHHNPLVSRGSFLKFKDGHVAEIATEWVTADEGGDRQEVTSFSQQVAFITQRYGAPTKTDVLKYRNAYGAEYDGAVAHWNLANGDTVNVREGYFLNDGVNVRRIYVTMSEPRTTDTAVKSPY